MEEYAKKWERQHTGYVSTVNEYSFEFVETAYNGKLQKFIEVKKYTVMKSYFVKLGGK